MEKVRIDKYLWAIRLFKTRTLAAVACDQGKIKLAGVSVKASRNVNVGDEYEVRTEARKWVIRVVNVIEKRVQYADAVKNYTDITPAEDLEKLQFEAAAFYTGKRNSKVGRPTKKQRRELDNFTTDE